MDWFRLEYPFVLIFIPFLIMGLWLTLNRLLVSGLTMFARLRVVSLRMFSFVLRSFIIIVLCLSLAGFQTRGTGYYLCRFYLIDNSGSILLNTAEVFDAIKKDAGTLQPADQFGILVFGRDVSLELAPIEKRLLTLNRSGSGSMLSSRINPEGTHIEQAIRTAINLFPSGCGKEIVLFTDGWETQGDAQAIIPLLQNQGITLYTIPTGPKGLQDIKIDLFQLPDYVSESEPILGRLVLSSSVDTSGTIYLYQDNNLIRELKEIPLAKGKQSFLSVELPPQERTVSVYEVQLATSQFHEFCQANNLGQAVVQKMGKPSILYLTEPQKNNLLETILTGIDEFRVDVFTVNQLNSIEPHSILVGYQVIVFNNLSIDSMTHDGLKPEILNALKESVEEHGKGLVVSGGKSSFGLGGYQGTLLEGLLPLWAKPKDTLGLVIIMDASGSMAETTVQVQGKNKFQIAREALEKALELLSEEDKLEVLTFNQDFAVLYPLQSAAGLTELNKRLNQVKPTGSTAILRPINHRALNTLSQTEATKKHIILISDGESTAGETVQDAQRLADLLAPKGISISTIATGSKINESFLKALSRNQTNGHFYHLKDIEELQGFLKQDLSHYKGFYRETAGLSPHLKQVTDIVKGIDQLPSLGGYCRTTLKERGQLIASIDANDEPLLATWQYGRGQVAVFTSSFDPNTGWTASWLDWDKLGQFIKQLIRWVAPPELPPETTLQVTTRLKDNHNLQVTVTSLAEDGNNLQLKAYLKKTGVPSVKVIESNIPQVASRKYEVIIPDLPQGSCLLDIISEINPVMRLTSKTVIIPYATEWRHFGPNLSYLGYLAEATGGKLLHNLAKPITGTYSAGETHLNKAYQRRDSFLIIGALVLLLLDLIIRKPFSYA